MRIILSTIILALALSPFVAVADMEFELGVVGSVYDDRADNAAGVQLKVDNTNWPLYGWIGYEQTTLKLAGYDVAPDSNMFGVGLGVSQDIGKFDVFIEAGWGFVDENVNFNGMVNGVYGQLEADHGPSPSPRPTADNNVHVDYSIDDSFVGRIGIGYQPFRHFKVTAAYRYFKPTEFYNIWQDDPGFAPGTYSADRRGWWQEKNNVDLNAFELGLFYTF